MSRTCIAILGDLHGHITLACRLLKRWEIEHDQAFAEFLQRFRIVTPVDLKRQDIKQRRDILDRKLNELKQEAPFACKGIGPVIQTLEAADMAQPVAELEPMLTVKG